jgi:CHAD domain-containing protein
VTAARATESSSDSRELELKYAVGDLDAVRQLVSDETVAGLAAGPWRTVKVVDQYLDTRTGALAKAGYGARLRHLDRRTLVTIKSVANAAARGSGRRRALHDRMELEARAARRLNPRHWPVSPARSLIEATAAGEELHTLFFLDQQREVRDLSRDGAVVATLSLDAATVRRFGRALGAFATLEVEAAPAAPAAARAVLNVVAGVLDESSDLRPEDRSKEQLALAIVHHALSARSAGQPPRRAGVTTDDPLSEAGRKVLRMHLLRMLAAEPGARAGEDIEAVHKMRVATRRMRAAWRVFDGAYRPRLQRRYVDELRDVASALGAVRDVDVQLERLAGHRAHLEPATAEALDPLVGEWQRRRDDARTELLDLLGGAAYDRFISDYLSFVETPGAGAVDAHGDRLRDVAAGRLWRAYERVRVHESLVPFADAPALHALRIDGKRLRYTLEFMRDILPAAADRLIADVTAMQDHLGLLNDAQIAADTTRAWLLESASRLTAAQRQAAGRYLKSSEADVARLHRTFRPIWRRLSSASFRRRLALAVGAI